MKQVGVSCNRCTYVLTEKYVHACMCVRIFDEVGSVGTIKNGFWMKEHVVTTPTLKCIRIYSSFNTNISVFAWVCVHLRLCSCLLCFCEIKDFRSWKKKYELLFVLNKGKGPKQHSIHDTWKSWSIKNCPCVSVCLCIAAYCFPTEVCVFNCELA